MERMTSLIRGRFRLKNAIAAAALSICSFIGMAAAPQGASGGAPVPRYERSLPEADVLIDVGHGGIDGGAHHGELLEKDINLAVAKRLYLMLGHRGVSAIMNRTGDYALSDENRWHVSSSRHRKDLSQRRQLSQEIPVRIMVSIHVNWSASSKANGPLVLHQREGRSALLAAFLQDAMNDAYSGIARSPKIGRPYFLLNNVHRPAVIIELGFISNPEDRLKLTDPRWQQRIATAIADGIRQYALVVE
jgi:N-acetylmuramoyl-L-alanine amidase